MEFHTEEERIYMADEWGKVLAEVTFPVKDGEATINHTYVHESLRGQGIASKMVKMAVDKIKSDGYELAATCSYAVAWLQRHPEIQAESKQA